MAQRAKTVAIYSGGGGVGKTLVAINLAISLYQQECGQVLVVDAGYPMPGDLPGRVGLERVKSLADIVPLLERLTPEVFATYVTKAQTGVAVMPLVNDVLQGRLIDQGTVSRMFELALAAFDVVILDIAAGVSPITAYLLDRSDDVVVVLEPSAQGLRRGRFCVDYLRLQQVPPEAVLICLNRTPEVGGVSAEQVERSLGLRVSAVWPNAADAIGEAAARGVPVLLASPRHALARAIDRFGRDVANRRLCRRAEAASGAIPASLTVEKRNEIKLTIHHRLVEEIDLKKADLTYLRDPVKLQEMRTRAEAKVLALVEEEAAQVPSRELRRRLVKEILDEALGLGPLEDLLAEPAVTEIMVNRHDQIYVERAGRLEATEVRFLTAEQLRGVIERIVAPLGRRIDEKVPMVDARLKDGSRVNAIIPPLALRGPALTIRKFSKRLLGVQDLIASGSMTEQMATFLGSAVQARLNLVISGGTGSGKTTLLNVLVSFVSKDERIITIEDSAELRLPQSHVVTLESRPANIEGEGAITIRDLVRNALRMRPDRIVVGECRGGEALDMLQAMNTGHDGSLTTVHANSPRDGLSRLETMALMGGLDLPAKAIRDQITSAINLIVQQTRLQDGSRRVTQITEVTGQEGGVLTTADVFVFRQTGLAPDGRVLGQFVPTGYVPAFVEGLSRRGIKVPREIFLHQTA